ncbi:MAG: hypothetical protein AAGU32_22295 [Bacillota bacterium]
MADAAGHPKVPILIRLLIMTVLFGGAATLFILIGFSALKATGMGGAIFFWLIASGFVLLWLYGCYKLSGPKKQQQVK